MWLMQIPSRRSLATNFLPKVLKRTLYDIIAVSISVYRNNYQNYNYIQSARGCPVAITTDGWTDSVGGGVHLVSITLHYIDDQWNYVVSYNSLYIQHYFSQNAVLATKPIEGPQTAVAIADVIKAYLLMRS